MLAHNRVWYLMARCLSNEASVAEKEELQTLLQQDEMLQQQYATLQELWKPSQQQELFSGNKLEKLLQKARQKEQEAAAAPVLELKPRSYKKVWWAAAASLLILVTSLFFLKKTTPQPTAEVVFNSTNSDSITTQKGSRSQLILPDGSRVWLNSGSRLVYQKNFNGTTREVQLIGEAYFDVVKMPQKPFIVHAEGINIRVLGTAFNVKCYPKDEKIEATLLRGAIAVTHKNDPEQHSILMKPNEKLSISKQFVVSSKPGNIQQQYQLVRIDTTILPSHLQETSWVYNRLEFRNMDFKTLADKMERWYNVNIVFLDKKVQALHFIGSFENETITEALHALQQVAAFRFEIKDNTVLIKSSN